MIVNTPILITINGFKYKIIYLSFGDDGSVYVIFPRKNGYKVSHDVELPNELNGEKSVSLEPTSKEIINPYISFHPKKKSIHINTKDKEIYKFDSDILNLSETRNIISFPLCQIIVLDLSNLDLYTNKKRHLAPVIMDESKIPKGIISIEIWIHTIGSYIEYEDLPLYESRIKKTNFLGFTRFHNKNLRFYSVTMFLESIKNDSNNDRKDHGIIVSVLNKNCPFAFKLAPII